MKFRNKKYQVKFSEIYLASSSPSRHFSSDISDSDNDIEICKNVPSISGSSNGPEVSPDIISTENGLLDDPNIPMRRSNRTRRPPER